jgi:hypothetical protein
MNPFILIGIAIVLLVIFYFLFRRTPEVPPPGGKGSADEDTFVFDPTQEAARAFARRKVTVIAPAQMMDGIQRRLVVEADSLPTLPAMEIPKEKGIDALGVLVINDRVRLADSDQEVYEFDPPLTYVIEYTKEDAASAPTNLDGTPRLSIVTGYHAEDGWKFERLPTTLQPDSATGGGTLTAQIANMHPKDPKWIGNP